MSRKQCKDCEYYEDDFEGLEEGTGRCLVLPPTIVGKKEGCFYPVVGGESKCMYFSRVDSREVPKVEQEQRGGQPVVSPVVSPVVRRK